MMGCDIHLYVEKRNAEGNWTAVDSFKRDEPDEGESKGHLYVDYREQFYNGRNYNLFAILADVRNGRGFAGIKTGEGFNPISEPRGVPDDASPEYAELVEQWGCDGHSHSHHTLRQILDYDWTQVSSLQGWANAVAWTKWSRWSRQNGEGPQDYCGGVSGPSIKHVTTEEMDELLKPVASKYGPEREEFAEQHRNTYALAQWTEPYHRAAGSFVGETIPRLLKLAGGTVGLDDVRIVFFFDN
jgi:hypothetical protein